MVAFLGTDVSPSSACSSPVIIRNSVVLPEPFGPTRPTFSPGLSWKDASTNRTCRPYCLLMCENEIIRSSQRNMLPIHQAVPNVGKILDKIMHLGNVIVSNPDRKDHKREPYRRCKHGAQSAQWVSISVTRLVTHVLHRSGDRLKEYEKTYNRQPDWNLNRQRPTENRVCRHQRPHSQYPGQ